VHLGGAQAYYKVTPDLTAMGKGMGNGMPISAIMGRADIMKMMEYIFYSGTFGGEALSLAASIAVIDKMKKDNVIDRLWDSGKKMEKIALEAIQANHLQDAIKISGLAPWKIVSFHDYEDVPKEAIKTRFLIETFRAGLLCAGSHNICYAHDDKDIQVVKAAYNTIMERIGQELKGGTLQANLDVPPIYPVFQVRS
jgi:glutamate-1-semialdehyde 2,1-aminomutase